MPHPPAVPRVDFNACPFEGCQFGKWTARKPVTVYSSWTAGRKVIARVKTGEKVKAITGANIVLQVGRGIFDRDVPMFGAKKGDVVYADPPYTTIGANNGFVRYNEHFFSSADQKRLAKAANRARRRGKPNVRWLRPSPQPKAARTCRVAAAVPSALPYRSSRSRREQRSAIAAPDGWALWCGVGPLTRGSALPTPRGRSWMLRVRPAFRHCADGNNRRPAAP